MGKEKGLPPKKRAVSLVPKGGNQWVTDPRQALFLAYYKDPKSTTFANATQSALRAGYKSEYAEAIINQMPQWLSGYLGNTSSLLSKAERNLEEFIDLPNETQAVGMYGPIFEKIKEKVPNGTFKNGKPKFKTVTKKVPVMALNPKVMKIKQDSSHFIAETVGKSKYNKRNDDGGDIYNVIVFANGQQSKIAKRILGGGSVGDTASA